MKEICNTTSKQIRNKIGVKKAALDIPLVEEEIRKLEEKQAELLVELTIKIDKKESI